MRQQLERTPVVNLHIERERERNKRTASSHDRDVIETRTAVGNLSFTRGDDGGRAGQKCVNSLRIQFWF